jgi:hypothetical protein
LFFITEECFLFIQLAFNVSADDEEIDESVGNWCWRITSTDETSSVNLVSNDTNRLNKNIKNKKNKNKIIVLS